MDTPRKLLTVAEAATALGLGRSLVYELVLRGELHSIKIGRARRIPLAALDAFIQQRLDTAESLGTPQLPTLPTLPHLEVQQTQADARRRRQA